MQINRNIAYKVYIPSGGQWATNSVITEDEILIFLMIPRWILEQGQEIALFSKLRYILSMYSMAEYRVLNSDTIKYRCVLTCIDTTWWTTKNLQKTYEL